VLIGVVLLVSLVGGEAATRGDRLVGGVLLMVSGGVVYGAWELIAQRRWLGMGALVLASVPWALGFRASVVLPLITVLVIAGAIIRARSTRVTTNRDG
jgi:hypothetical protein